MVGVCVFFFSSRRRHTRWPRDWSSDVCSSDLDADLSLIKGKQVTIIGYGSQGHAHAQNLNDSGVKVTVGLRKGGASWGKVEKAGLKVAEVADAVRDADVVMILLPDEQIGAVYKNDVEPHIRKGA